MTHRKASTYTGLQNKEKWIYIHASSEIPTHDPSIRVV